ncbi:glycosyltransferase family 4 protein [Helicobacter didelphidarum]|uniref:Glycosyltransferase family 4 protein n=1 Tax=Helicobacter didelphidarum TaxID=2040648 RepID=A0A3D8IK48_9HELI|nr:glycosyltransferase family 4 protein [Helicobacter didelphidarum]RDU65256.1 glycosyltransferase family 4 protein [Helicobacter didelphidarum]
MQKLMIILRDITENGGGERVCANLVNAFLESFKVEVEIVSFYRLNPAPFYKILPQAQITYLSSSTILTKNKVKKFWNKTLYRLYLSYKAMKYIKKSHATIVLANDGVFIPFSKIKNINLLRIWHIKIPKKKKRIFDRFKTIIVLSSRNLAQWQHYHNNVKVIPNFLPIMPSIQTQYDKKRILAAGRMSTEKGFDRLINTYAMIAKEIPDWELVIAGDGILKHELQAQIEFLGLQEYIKLLPFTQDMESLYLSASICVMSSYTEGFSMVLLEAGSYGLPCVSFDIEAGPKDIIEDSKSGYLIPDNDCELYAKKLKALVDDKNLRETMGQSAREIVKKKFGKESIMLLWKEVLFCQ